MVGAVGAIVIGAGRETVNGGGRALPVSPPVSPSPPPGLIHTPFIGCSQASHRLLIGR